MQLSAPGCCKVLASTFAAWTAPDGDTISVEALSAKGLAKGLAGGVKVLGRGEVTKKFTLSVHGISPTARQKIEQAGGTVGLIGQAAPAASE